MLSLFRCYCRIETPRYLSSWSSRDKGPEKNYRKKINKALKKEGDVSVSSSLLDKLQDTEKQSGDDKTTPVDLSDILSEIKIHIRTDVEVRRNLGMPSVEPPSNVYRSVPRRQPPSRLHSFTEGQRLEYFNKPSADTPVMPAEEWDFFKEDEIKQVELLNSLRLYSNPFEKMLEKESSSLWKYPIDNEAYPNDENDVGFEEHVFLDKELENGFPKKGPVRHFMELVVTGLTSNPHLSVQDKHRHIKWYREYFSQFPEDELHVAMPTDTPHQSQQAK